VILILDRRSSYLGFDVAVTVSEPGSLQKIDQGRPRAPGMILPRLTSLLMGTLYSRSLQFSATH
jgi:hypothetical protein